MLPRPTCASIAKVGMLCLDCEGGYGLIVEVVLARRLR